MKGTLSLSLPKPPESLPIMSLVLKVRILSYTSGLHVDGPPRKAVPWKWVLLIWGPLDQKDKFQAHLHSSLNV